MTKISKMKLPRRIGGIKIPKTMRKPGKLLKSPLARELLAVALVAGVAAASKDQRVQRKFRKVKLGAKYAAGEGLDMANRVGRAVSDAIVQAAHRLYPEHDDRPIKKGKGKGIGTAAQPVS